MSFLPLLLRAALKKGDKSRLHQAFTERQPIALPDTATVSTYTAKSYQSMLDSYNAMHDWRSSCLHPCFPQVLGMGQQMEAMLNPKSPFPLVGLVHLSNHINIQQLPENKDITLTCGLSDSWLHQKGLGFSVDLVAQQAGETCLSAQSHYLFRIQSETRSSPVDNPIDSDSHQSMGNIALSESAGRQYAKLSGDYNPIHLWHWSARLLGFHAPIAHGMHSLALVLSAMHSKHELDFNQASITNEFLNPIFLPSQLQWQLASNTNPQDDKSFFLKNEKASKRKQVVLTGEIQTLAG